MTKFGDARLNKQSTIDKAEVRWIDELPFVNDDVSFSMTQHDDFILQKEICIEEFGILLLHFGARVM